MGHINCTHISSWFAISPRNKFKNIDDKIDHVMCIGHGSEMSSVSPPDELGTAVYGAWILQVCHQWYCRTISSRKTQPELVIPIFQAEAKLCVYTCLCEYIKRTKPLRGKETRLFISYVKPHKWVSKYTIAWWVKIVMQQAGVDERLFKPHSTRAASTSKAFSANVPLASIITAGSWKSECAFQKFYNKPIWIGSGLCAIHPNQ